MPGSLVTARQRGVASQGWGWQRQCELLHAPQLHVAPATPTHVRGRWCSRFTHHTRPATAAHEGDQPPPCGTVGACDALGEPVAVHHNVYTFATWRTQRCGCLAGARGRHLYCRSLPRAYDTAAMASHYHHSPHPLATGPTQGGGGDGRDGAGRFRFHARGLTHALAQPLELILIQRFASLHLPSVHTPHTPQRG